MVMTVYSKSIKLLDIVVAIYYNTCMVVRLPYSRYVVEWFGSFLFSWSGDSCCAWESARAKVASWGAESFY